MDKKIKNTPKNFNAVNDTEIYKPEDFKLEFDNLLQEINKDDSNENIQEEPSKIDLDFLKNDYLDLYDLGKLLNNPQYYLAKFKIRFFDFINLNDYFYKLFSKDEIKEEKNISKTKSKKKKTNFFKSSVKLISKTEKNPKKIESSNDKEQQGLKEVSKHIKLINSKNNSIEIKSNVSKKDLKDVNYQKKSSLEQSDGKNKENFKINENSIDNSYKCLENNKSLNVSDFNKSISVDDSFVEFSKENISLSDSNQKKMNISQLSKVSDNYSILQTALTDFNEYSQKQKIRQFQFKFIKKELGLEENEKMSGTAYEEFARKCFQIMIMIINQRNIKLENIKDADLTDFLTSYLNNSKIPELKINTNIHNIIVTNLINAQMEIDIVAELKFEAIKQLIQYFPKNIFFKEDLENEGKKIILNSEITLMAEISRNIIIQGTEKLPQTIRYIEFISILNLYKDKAKQTNESNADFKPFNQICQEVKIKEKTEKIFCMITDGDYIILKFAFNEIIKKLIETEHKNNDEIKNSIHKTISSNQELNKKIEEKEIKYIEENIFNIYLMIDKLKKNKIKFFILYIGDIGQSIYQQNLISKIIANKSIFNSEEYGSFINSFQKNQNLKTIKCNYKKIKTITSSFIKEIDSLTNTKLNDKKHEFNLALNDYFKNIDFSGFNEIKNELKFEFDLNVYCGNEDLIILEKLKKMKNDYNFIINNEIKRFENFFEFNHSYQNDLESFVEPKKFKIYIICLEEKYSNDLKITLPNYDSDAVKKGSYNVRMILYSKKKINSNTNYQYEFHKSDLQNIFDKKFININKFILEKISVLKRNIKYSKIPKDKNEILNVQNLKYKLEDEFSMFQRKTEIPFPNKIDDFDFSLSKEEYLLLLKYFQEAFELINMKINAEETQNEINSNDINIDNPALKTKLNMLTENILCRKIYGLIYYQLLEFINDLIYNQIIIFYQCFSDYDRNIQTILKKNKNFIFSMLFY